MKLKLYSLVIFLMFTVSAFAFPIPDTGITKCYDNEKEIPCPTAGQDFYGQDANYSINPMSYTKLDSTGVALPVTATDWAMVKDNVTGLIWENNSHQSTWNDAPNVIASLNTAKFGGYSDWRLPTLLELSTIIDYSIPYPGPTINTNVFKDMFRSFYWSNSTYAGSMNFAWGVNFDDGHDGGYRKSYDGYVCAVRGGQLIIGHFDPLVINGDRIVSDTATGLMWQQDIAKTATGGITMVWKDALSYCENLTLGGYTDWRLPTVKELRSIVDYSTYNPAIDTGAFKDTFASDYWSSSANPYDIITSALCVNFNHGYDVSCSNKSYDGYVRAVRNINTITGNKPTATTSPATSVTSNSATLNGTVNPNSSATTYYFEYGLTTSYGQKTTSQIAGSGSTDSAVKADITGLTPKTTYHFRLVATNTVGTTNGNDLTFTTLDTPPASPANLTVASISVPSSAQLLTQSTISWNIKNSGQKDAAGSWIDQLYLSSDETLGSDDILLGEFTKSNGLGGDTDYQQTEKINIPKVEPGFYYIILKADSNSTLSESDETDNIFVQPITITTVKLMTAAPDRIELSIVGGNTQTGSLQISNISTVDMSGITATVKNAPSNITVQITPPTLLKSLTSQTITYTVKAVDDSVSTGEITVLFADSQGNEASVLFVIKVLPGTPKLATNPGYLESGMLRGNQRSVEFELSNIGGASADNLKIAIPQASWLKLVTPENIGSLAAGAKTNVVLMLKPSNDMTLGPYTGELVVSGSNANLRVGFKFTAVSDAKGNLKVIAEDEFTYFAEDKPNVSGAEVLVKDAFDNSKVIAQGITDATGVFLTNNINEGRYDIEVRAEKHASYHSTIEIVSSMTKVVRAFMKRQFVSYKWTVEPTEIEDKYQVVLEVEFETHVPAPVVVVEPRTQVALIPEGETATVNVTVTNHGLIAAQGVKVDFADSDKYEVVPLIKDIGELPAMTSVVVPVNIRAKSVAVTKSGANGTTRSDLTKDEYCDFLDGKAIDYYYCGSDAVWREVVFGIKPLIVALEVMDVIECRYGVNKLSCLSFLCSAANELGKADPCTCMLISFANLGTDLVLDPGFGLVFGTIGSALDAMQCMACGTNSYNIDINNNSTVDIVDVDNNSWNFNNFPDSNPNISGPSPVENRVYCDPATRPKPKSAKTDAEAAPSDISRYGGRIVKYRVIGK